MFPGWQCVYVGDHRFREAGEKLYFKILSGKSGISSAKTFCRSKVLDILVGIL